MGLSGEDFSVARESVCVESGRVFCSRDGQHSKKQSKFVLCEKGKTPRHTAVPQSQMS